MKFISISKINEAFLSTAKRFPLVVLVALLGTIAAVLLVNFETQDPDPFLVRLLMCCALGLPLFIAIQLLNERLQSGPVYKAGLKVIGLILLILYFFYLPGSFKQFPAYYFVEFAIINLGLHFLVAIIPYLLNYSNNGFWQYNKSLFIRILLAALYSAVLYIGLSVAILSMQNLFDIDIDPKRYFQLWIIILGFFNTFFFLSGVPENFIRLEKEKEYPKGLKIFTQYVLVPLVSVYMLILYAYMLKIVIQGVWPKGWVSMLILSFSVVGILAILLLFPVKNASENKWIQTFSRIYYFILVPLIIMLFLAIGIRVNEYGLTEARYYVIVLGIVLSLVTLYFIFSKQGKIIIIPFILFVFAFLTVVGPWSAVAMSKNSQLDRLEDFLAKKQMLKNGMAISASQKISFNDAKEISSIIDYLLNMHGIKTIQPLFSQDLDSVFRDSSEELQYRNDPSKITALLNIRYINRWENDSTKIRAGYNFNATNMNYDIKGYDRLITYIFMNNNEKSTIVLSRNIESSKTSV